MLAKQWLHTRDKYVAVKKSTLSESTFILFFDISHQRRHALPHLYVKPPRATEHSRQHLKSM